MTKKATHHKIAALAKVMIRTSIIGFLGMVLSNQGSEASTLQCHELDREACGENNKCQWYSASAGCAGQSPECVGKFREDACTILPGCHWSKHPGFCSEKK